MSFVGSFCLGSLWGFFRWRVSREFEAVNTNIAQKVVDLSRDPPKDRPLNSWFPSMVQEIPRLGLSGTKEGVLELSRLPGSLTSPCQGPLDHISIRIPRSTTRVIPETPVKTTKT